MRRFRRAVRFALPGLVAGLLMAGVAQATPAKGDVVQIPALTLMDGRQLPAGYYSGKPVVIQYWASWCPFCGRQNPYFQRLWDTARETGLEVLTVSVDKDEADARTYLHDRQYTFPAVMESPELRQAFGKRRVIPKVFVVRSDGRIAEVIPGEMFEEDVLDLIKYAPNR
ncbi:MAG TPA: TlpA disulfide reductase family protein [Burkholderiaceae bacterium]|nr:TlpA disulfide reductase family protein [Burkholderiaceae bacterium]